MRTTPMKNHFWGLLLVGSSMVFCQAASAQDSSMASKLEGPEIRSPDRYGLSFRLGFNISADFSHSGSFLPQGHLVPIPGRGNQLQPANPDGDAIGDRTYEDGFIWKDSSGNAFGYTRYWGYDRG